MARGYPEPKDDLTVATPVAAPGRCAMCGKGPIDHFRTLCDECRAIAGHVG